MTDRAAMTGYKSRLDMQISACKRGCGFEKPHLFHWLDTWWRMAFDRGTGLWCIHPVGESVAHRVTNPAPQSVYSPGLGLMP